MKIEILMFAAAKETAGRDRVTVLASEPMTSKLLMRQLGQLYPDLNPLLPSCRLAVDDQYVGDQFMINDTHEVALIPPVSGG